MAVQDKYLAIRIVGHNTIYAYFNEDCGKKDGKQRPMFKGDGVGVWVNKAEPRQKPEEVRGADWDEFI